MSDIIKKHFGTKDVKVESSGKVNLVDVAKCCGLTRIANSGNEVVCWKNGTKGITGKLNIIRTTKVVREIEEEINNILTEIDETDDRNSIFISSWLAKRIATECHSDTANEFKNWLVTLDEAREQGFLEVKNNYITKTEVKSIVEDATIAITNSFAPIISEMQRQNKSLQDQNTTLTNLLIQQDEKRTSEIEIYKQLVGLKPKNTNAIGKALLSRERKYYKDKYINHTSKTHLANKTNLCTHFGVSAYCNIPIERLDEVFQYIEIMGLVDYIEQCKVYDK